MAESKVIKKNTEIYPVIPMRGIVAFPNLVVHFDVAREASVNAIQDALKGDRKIFVVTQKEAYDEHVNKDGIYKVGVIAAIRQVLKAPDDTVKILIEGISKAKVVDFYEYGKDEDMFYRAEVKEVNNNTKYNASEIEMEALLRTAKELFERYSELVPKMPSELLASILDQKDPDELFESIVFNANFQYNDKQVLLEQNNAFNRISALISLIKHETDILEIEMSIHEQAKDSLTQNQKEYILREHLKAISMQLGEDGDPEQEAADYREKIEALNVEDKYKEKLNKEVDRLLRLPASSAETSVIKNYIDTVLDLPWNTETKIKVNIKKSEDILEKDHYGLKRVKERILESIAVHALKPDINGQIICLVGPPGVGKTSIGRSIAKALGRTYVRISLGGVRDESDIRGHRKTYIGAMPGRIANAMIQAGTKNPLILFDEIDKMSNDFRGDPSAAMLEVLDSEQNKEFRDHFIEIPFDLSKVMFITTANSTQTIPGPLLDRMEIIDITSYTRDEKFHIAKEHLIPKQLKKTGLKGTQIKITDDGILKLIDSYTKEAGVRSLERQIASLCRKTAKEIVGQKAKKLVFDETSVKKYLGPEKYIDDIHSSEDETGIVNGLAWTSVGGVLMPLEVLVLDGKGTVEVTGSLGDVMKESAKIAVSYARSVAEKYNIDKNFYKEKDLHIHAPEGAVPKDGPSAGVTMITAMISALSGIKVRSDVAMTGEITLHGKVLPIGGLREKTMAAYKAKIKTVIIPAKNKPDLEEVDDVVKDNIEFIFAEKIEDVLEHALVNQ